MSRIATYYSGLAVVSFGLLLSSGFDTALIVAGLGIVLAAAILD